jgi:hypothetical protein
MCISDLFVQFVSIFESHKAPDFVGLNIFHGYALDALIQESFALFAGLQ